MEEGGDEVKGTRIRLAGQHPEKQWGVIELDHVQGSFQGPRKVKARRNLGDFHRVREPNGERKRQMG